ncbi:ficolin-2-like [Saccostrea cucullata]|uniref:ficolin-2-like n=1 Tax=Saccostrea cuccullata TaxID=36930 RepID=UPI002ED318B0
METQGGGWTVIQKRNRDENLSFDRTWEEYKNGFGTPPGDVWIGNDVINQLTKGNDSSLYVSITQEDKGTAYELYGRFSVSDETDKYRLYLGGPATGTLELTVNSHHVTGLFVSAESDGNRVASTDVAVVQLKEGDEIHICSSPGVNVSAKIHSAR